MPYSQTLNQKVNNIVLACENLDADNLVSNVNEVLFEKMFYALDAKKTEMGKNFFSEATSFVQVEEKDGYDKADDKLKEAIDYVVETVLESQSDIWEAINTASEKFEVKGNSLKEYFIGFLGEAYGTSAACSDSDYKNRRNQGAMGDMDTDKRTRYESKVMEKLKEGNMILSLQNGSKIEVDTNQGKALTTVYENLNEENQTKMFDQLTKSRKDFLGMVDFSLRLTESK